MTFIQRLDMECKNRNTSITALLRDLKISPSKGTNWRGGSLPSAEDLLAISEALSLPLEYLLTGKNSELKISDLEMKVIRRFRQLPDDEKLRFYGRIEEIADRYNEQYKAQRRIKMTSMKVYREAAGAGSSTPFTSDDEFDILQFPAESVPYGADCGIRINGDSMEPEYPDDSIIWVKETDDVAYGDLVVAILNGSPYFKVYQTDGLHSLNPAYGVISVGENDSFRIFGRVIGCLEN